MNWDNMHPLIHEGNIIWKCCFLLFVSRTMYCYYYGELICQDIITMYYGIPNLIVWLVTDYYSCLI
jgi:hypothetical protein